MFRPYRTSTVGILLLHGSLRYDLKNVQYQAKFHSSYNEDQTIIVLCYCISAAIRKLLEENKTKQLIGNIVKIENVDFTFFFLRAF